MNGIDRIFEDFVNPEIEKLKKALEFYADENNYDDNGAPCILCSTLNGDKLELDEGKIARKALEGK